jgi:hypothetical protein
MKAQEGRFYNILNEGDPLVLAQLDYLVPLREVWLCPLAELQQLNDMELPTLFFKPAEPFLLLRNTQEETPGEESLQICKVEPSHMEKKLFGNIPKHYMGEYRRRVFKLASENCQRLNHDCGGKIEWKWTAQR